jgi:hypothetical protein
VIHRGIAALGWQTSFAAASRSELRGNQQRSLVKRFTTS